jgi:multicomponent Na+:H+ antiporter subunit B
VIRRACIVVVVVLLAVVFASLVANYMERQSLPLLAQRYVELVPRELGAPNVVTGILLTYRAFDTLGEVAVLFMAAGGVGLVLGAREARNAGAPGEAPEGPRQASEIVETGSQILVPLIAIFAAYIIMNGHLSAGGGFQGGAVIASSALLLVLASPRLRLDLDFLGATESAAGVLFVLTGVAGLIFAGGFLDNRVLPLGRFGAFFSAGAIPLLSTLLGVKVGCELTVIIDRFRA